MLLHPRFTIATVLVIILLLTPTAAGAQSTTHGADLDLPRCSYMSQDEASSLVGQPVEPGKSSGPGWLTECVFTAADQLASVVISVGNWGTDESAQDSYDFKLFASNVTEKLGPAGAVRTNDVQTELLAFNGPYVVSVSVMLPVVKPTGADMSPFATRMFDGLALLN
jgi:hypothetical protein